jgi:hypothetical protein
MLAAIFPPLTKPKKPTGQILDPTAFADVRSYCVDRSTLPGNQAYEVDGFVREESKPGRLLTKIPWKLYADCREASPQATVKLEFPRMNVISVPLGQQPTLADQHPYRIKAVLLVLDAESSKVIYRNQADPLDSPTLEEQAGGDPPVLQRRNAMYGAFWALAQDVKQAQQAKK